MLSLLTDELTASVAAFDITENLDLNDSRFGNAGNTEILCSTCGMRGEECTGHHALLDLGMFMFHPLAYKESQDILNRTCFGCGNVLQQISKFKAKRCPECKLGNSGDYVIYAQDLTYAVRQSTGERRHASTFPYGILPDGYVISKILVPPIHLRTPEDMEWSTEIQKLYEQLIDVLKGKTVLPRTKVKNIPVSTGRSGSSWEKSKSAMLTAAYSRIVGAQKTEGVVGMLSGTNGIFRQLMLGKRVDSSARTVITGDSTLRINEVSVPKKISDRIRVKVTCGKYNIAHMKQLANKKKLWWEDTDDSVHPQNILPGMVFDRNLENGDLVMLNRQPSLSKSSLVCFKVVLQTDVYRNVFSINPQVTSTFNADFDGDEMNTFFMSNTIEMAELCHVSEDDLTPVQDVVTGCYLMSKLNAPVSREIWEDCVVISLENSWGGSAKNLDQPGSSRVSGTGGSVSNQPVLAGSEGTDFPREDREPGSFGGSISDLPGCVSRTGPDNEYWTGPTPVSAGRSCSSWPQAKTKTTLDILSICIQDYGNGLRDQKNLMSYWGGSDQPGNSHVSGTGFHTPSKSKNININDLYVKLENSSIINKKELCSILCTNNVNLNWGPVTMETSRLGAKLSLHTPNLSNGKFYDALNNSHILDKKKLNILLHEGKIDLYTLQLVVLRWLSTYGLTVPLESIVTDSEFKRHQGEDPDSFKNRCLEYVTNTMSNSKKSFGLMSMINSSAKGSAVHASHMALTIGQQYVKGKEGIFCDSPYSTGLTPREFFGHQMAAREGVVSTGVNTATTGYLNRRACKALADLKVQYNGIIADDVMISSFKI